MKEKILYITDLDGTLLDNSGKLKRRHAKMLNRYINKGCLFTYATARGFISSQRVVGELKPDIPVITMGGAMFHDFKTGKILYTHLISEKSNMKAWAFIREKIETPLVYAIIDGKERVSYLKDNTGTLKNYLYTRKGDPRFRPCNDYDEMFQGEIFYYCFINPKSDIKVIDAVFSAENGFTSNYMQDTYYPQEFWYEALSSEASKGNAALKLKEITGADKIIAFGDNLNDISLFKAADECYAVENAHPGLKEYATGIIQTNEYGGVPSYIEKENSCIFLYEPHQEIIIESNQNRFKTALEEAVTRKSVNKKIGTLKEKTTHLALKNYFSDELSQEIKIGPFHADVLSENGIYEIQTARWMLLRDKLDIFLDVCHVTVVYPFEKFVHNIYLDEITGEVYKKTPLHVIKKMTSFFIELYRIKEYLTDPNLTVCIAEMEIEKSVYVDDERCLRKRKQKTDKAPINLRREIYLENKSDYRIFLPENLPEKFDKKIFGKNCKISEPGILLEILQYMNLVHKCGKSGNSILYSVSPQSD